MVATVNQLCNCKKCGKPVRLGGLKIRVNRKPGVAHYIAHMDGTPMHERGWDCIALKPYPLSEEDKEWRKLCDRWNKANTAETMLGVEQGVSR